MNVFKGRHFTIIIILWPVRWYCKYGISYRELQEMLAERGVYVDYSTIYRWVQRYAPEVEKWLRWYWRNPSDLKNWHLDETYVKVNGKWAYLYRAVDSRGQTIEFTLSPRRNTKAAYRFIRKYSIALKHGKYQGSLIRIKLHLMAEHLISSNMKENSRHVVGYDITSHSHLIIQYFINT